MFNNSRVRFKINKQLIKQRIKELAVNISKDDKFLRDIWKANQELAYGVRHYLVSTSTRDPLATDVKNSGLVNQIALNIRGYAFRSKSGIVGGVGDIELMDSADPLLSMDRLIGNSTVRLWRILEYGTRKHTITARNVPNLFFFYKRIGSTVSTHSVDHPGTLGRLFFITGAYAGWRRYREHVKRALTSLFDRVQ